MQIASELDYRVATEADLPVVLEVLDDAAAWLWERRLHQWPERFQPSWVVPALSCGETWLVFAEGCVVGTFTMSWEDTAWPEYPDDAGYVHRFAVCRSAAGIGSRILEPIRGITLDEGRRFLRLDCVASNEGLRRYYERAGFRHCGDIEVSGAPGQRLIGGGQQVIVSRYEQPL